MSSPSQRSNPVDTQEQGMKKRVYVNLMQAGPSDLSEQFVICVFLCVLMRNSVYQLSSVLHLGTFVV